MVRIVWWNKVAPLMTRMHEREEEAGTYKLVEPTRLHLLKFSTLPASAMVGIMTLTHRPLGAS
jgi:hypothetical protein